ncbi:MAG: P-II family nitrogen regulator [Eubacteriales bacterium]|jgi:nitrogen regulatory protein PII
MELYLLLVVTDRKLAPNYRSMMKKNGIARIFSLNASGTASKDLLSILGLESSDKTLLLAAADRAKTTKVFKDAKQKLYIDIPGTGIVTAIPIRSIGGTKTLDYLTNDKNISKTLPKYKFDKEMIFVILNGGYSDEVMDAARAAGAGGGTVLEAKGTGAKFAEKFLGMTIAEDKQVLLIATRIEKRDAIMSAIMEKCGPGTKPGAVAFSVPVAQIAGVRLDNESEDAN